MITALGKRSTYNSERYFKELKTTLSGEGQDTNEVSFHHFEDLLSYQDKLPRFSKN